MDCGEVAPVLVPAGGGETVAGASMDLLHVSAAGTLCASNTAGPGLTLMAPLGL